MRTTCVAGLTRAQVVHIVGLTQARLAFGVHMMICSPPPGHPHLPATADTTHSGTPPALQSQFDLYTILPLPILYGVWVNPRNLTVGGTLGGLPMPYTWPLQDIRLARGLVQESVLFFLNPRFFCPPPPLTAYMIARYGVSPRTSFIALHAIHYW